MHPTASSWSARETDIRYQHSALSVSKQHWLTVFAQTCWETIWFTGNRLRAHSAARLLRICPDHWEMPTVCFESRSWIKDLQVLSHTVSEPLTNRGVLLSTLLQDILNPSHHLLNVFLQIANKLGIKKTIAEGCYVKYRGRGGGGGRNPGCYYRPLT
jgi:hypothetical protein